MTMKRPRPSSKNCVENLQLLGFSGYEAQVYLALLESSPATAYEISKSSGLLHANVYRTLETLEKKSAVQPVTQRPTRYVPVDPGHLLQTISKRTAAVCEELAARLLKWGRPDEIEHVWLVHGAESTHEKIEEMIAGAKMHLWIKAHEQTLDLHLKALRSAAQRGVNIIIIFLGNPSSAKRYALGRKTKVCCHEGTGRSGIGEGRNSLTMTADLKAALTVDTREDGYGAFTRSPPVVNLANTMIRHELYVAEIFNSFGSQIEEKFGPALIKLRKHYLPKKHVKALEREIRALAKGPSAVT